MSAALERKRRAVQTALFGLTLWPLVQMALVFALDVSPWKLGAWGMYAAPAKVPHLALLARGPGQPELRPVLSPHPSLAEPIRAYMTARTDLGPLYGADGLAAAVFAAYPAISELRLSYVELRLDRRTARLVQRPFTYAFERGPGSEGIRSIR